MLSVLLERAGNFKSPKAIVVSASFKERLSKIIDLKLALAFLSKRLERSISILIFSTIAASALGFAIRMAALFMLGGA